MTPGDNRRIIAPMVDKASALFDHAIKKRQIVELLLTKHQEASAKAKGALKIRSSTGPRRPPPHLGQPAGLPCASHTMSAVVKSFG